MGEVVPNDHNAEEVLETANYIAARLLGDHPPFTLTTTQYQKLSDAVDVLREVAHNLPEGILNKSGRADAGLTVAGKAIESFLPLTPDQLPVTFAIALGFMESFSEFANKQFGVYEDVLLEGYRQLFMTETKWSLVPADQEKLERIAHQGREVIIRTLHATMYRHGSVMPSMAEQVTMLRFLLEAPSNLSPDAKDLSRIYEKQVRTAFG